MSAPATHVAMRDLALWLRCPRQFWFEHVASLEPTHRIVSPTEAVDAAGHAGMRVVLQEPGAPRERVREAMFAAFDDEFDRARERGLSLDPDQGGRALGRIEGELLDLVLRLGHSPRVRAIEWTHLDWPIGLQLDEGCLSGRIDAVGTVREPVASFGESDGQAVALEPGTRVVVDWRFERDIDTSRVGLGLDLGLAFHAVVGAGVLRSQSKRVRAFAGAVLELLPRRPSGERGQPLPRFERELNPAYLEAFAAGRPITAQLRAEALACPRRMVVEGATAPKWLERPNAAYALQAGLLRGPVFHEAPSAEHLVWPLLRRALRELSAALQSGDEARFLATGPLAGACVSCPFRGRCL